MQARSISLHAIIRLGGWCKSWEPDSRIYCALHRGHSDYSIYSTIPLTRTSHRSFLDQQYTRSKRDIDTGKMGCSSSRQVEDAHELHVRARRPRRAQSIDMLYAAGNIRSQRTWPRDRDHQWRRQQFHGPQRGRRGDWY